MILRQAVDQVNVRADQLADPAYMLDDVIAVVCNEFQVERWDVLAGEAGAGGGPLHGNLPVPKGNIDVFQEFKQCLAACDPVLPRMGKDGIPFQL
jgi:hypothetical protein